MDSRCNPYEVLGFKPYEIIALRNPGGRVRSCLVDLSAIDTLFGINQIIILQHSNCGTTHFTSQDHINNIKLTSPNITEDELALLRYHSPCKKDNDDAVKEDLKALRECKLIPQCLRDNSIGLYLNVKTGLVQQVV